MGRGKREVIFARTLRENIESRIGGYFSSLELPPSPTIYDYLVLSLRKKDVIATFNWDPFLWQALDRNSHITDGPHFFFLHGCAVVGFCANDKTQGLIGTNCWKCDQPFVPTKLLYPVEDKDYISDPYIESQWRNLKGSLKSAFVFTIFGYSAPDTDVAAIELLSEGWGKAEEREYEETELINIESREDLRSRWNKFIFSHHYQIWQDYMDSLLAKYPRRTCEALWSSLLEARFVDEISVPKFNTLPELQDWFIEIVEHEG